MVDEWDADFITVQEHLDALNEVLESDLELGQYRQWDDFAMMVENRALRFRRADTFKVGNEPSEGRVHDRVRYAFGRPGDDLIRDLLELSK